MFAYNWGFHTLATYMPTYMKDMLNVDISNATLVTMCPFLFLVVSYIVGGTLGDFFIKKGCKRLHVRKYFYIINSLIGGVCLMLSSFAMNEVLCVVLMTASVGISSMSTVGVSPNVLEISPSFGGVLLGICNGIGAIHIFFFIYKM